MKDNSHVRIVDFSEDEPDTRIYCPACERVGFRAVLGPKIILAGEQKEQDHDQWLQCPACGWLCPIFQAEPEPQIQDTAETIDNPFDNAEGQVLSVENRASITKKRRRKAFINRGVTKSISRSQKGEQKIDPDIEREIQQHGEGNVKVVYDSGPR